jgi:hypothetical protein
MRNPMWVLVSLLAVAMSLTIVVAANLSSADQAAKQDTWLQWTPASPWKPNDRNRPLPPVITPGIAGTQTHAGVPPSDATILFNGKDLSNWESIKGGPAKWTAGDGYFMVVGGTGDIQTKNRFGDCQLHVEWAAPNPPHGRDQDRGNSGIFLGGLYEIQVLDSYQNVTYADGEAAAVYGQYPPLVNASLKPGEWQVYDIVFHVARFDGKGKLTRRPTVTILHNGVLVQDHVEIKGQNADHTTQPYPPTAEKLPLRLQDHHHPVRFRNIWVRELNQGA